MRSLLMPLLYSCISLKSKEPRLRDWNEWSWWLCSGAIHPLEIKRTSITRLKLDVRFNHINKVFSLKSKEPRLRDWNMMFYNFANKTHLLEIKRTSITRLKLWEFKEVLLAILTCLKSKEPRLRDWNYPSGFMPEKRKCPWNQKNLDYEIETLLSKPLSLHLRTLKSKEPRLRDWNLSMFCWDPARRLLEIKRTSITRLKRDGAQWRCNGFYSWNQKNLDYEIETKLLLLQQSRRLHLEIKRTSITRLKQTRCLASIAMAHSWNQKNLDYEIETIEENVRQR